jgi:hypothetical protein
MSRVSALSSTIRTETELESGVVEFATLNLLSNPNENGDVVQREAFSGECQPAESSGCEGNNAVYHVGEVSPSIPKLPRRITR